MTILCRVHERGNELLVAACDERLLGETFREGEVVIDVKEAFYGGDPIDPKELGKVFDRATIANLTGQETVRVAIDLGFVDEDRVLRVDGVPHAQFAVMRQ